MVIIRGDGVGGEPFAVQAFVTNFSGSSERFADNLSYRPLAETLRLAWELIGGIPGAWCGIRRRGKLVASLETNHKGELSDAEVYREYPPGAGGWPVVIVTPLNPGGPLFAGVFA